MHKHLTRLATGLALLTALSAQAQVGLATLPVQGRPLTLVYPTASTARAVEFGPFRLDVAPDAPLSPGQHRLIVMSHGTGGSATADHALAAALARAGFVVAQVEHEGDNFRDHRLSGPDSFRRRPAEAVQAIDALAADPKWSKQLDLSRVGVHGMSAGGVTALSLAGGQWSMLALVRHCGAHLDEDPGFCLQGAVTPEQKAERAKRFEAAKGVPDAYLPADLRALQGGRTPTTDQPEPRPDPRIAAVTLAVPVAAIFTPESLARIRVPVGIVATQNDRVLLPRFHSGQVLANCSTCRLLTELPGAGHFDLLRPWPEAVAREVAAGQVRGGDVTPGLDPALLTQAHDRIVAFHRQHLMTQP
ncbi:alpha/beta hydrolase family protein [Hydrogenophaga sp. RWCD_12]|uniref:alpha/beta hydrolase family protein n=1 Tax=Hydrogenophaga sp. RWCD_12 TaxID=3391190 RepID=UPI003985407C